MRVLVVEDDPMIGRAVVAGLHGGGYTVDWVRDGGEAELALANGVYDLALLDLGLPRRDGLEILKSLRRVGKELPVVIITARDSVADRVTGLDNGADDYLTKPFHFDELGARLRALARRGPVERAPVLRAGGLRLDPATRRVWRDEHEIALSAKEFALLEEFMRRPGQVLSRFHLLEHAWDGQYENRSNVVDVYVGYLRDKLDRPFGVASLETVRGVGYRLREVGAP